VPAVASTQRTVKIDGSDLTAEIDGALESVLVVDRLAMPDMFTLTFRDPNRDILGKAGLEIGRKVEVSTGSLRDDAPEVLIEGEVTSIEADYDTLGSRAIVRGYDRSHRLTAGRKTATFQEMSYSEIAKKIAGDNGLTAECDDSGASLEHTLQANVSDLDFLYGLARRIGFDCRVEGTTLLFKRPAESSGAPGEGDFTSADPFQLVWNHNLLEFRARMSAVAQVAEVKVRGWDVKEKQAVIGQADVTAPNADLSMTPKDLADIVGGETLLVVDHPVGTQELADGLALARAQQVGSAAFEATAVALGSPALKAGAAVNVSGIDAALQGKWVITGSRHEFGQGGYRTHLEFTGRQDRSIHGLVAQGSGGTRERYYGVAVATVTDIDDPQKMARVKVMLPWLSEDVSTTWARLVAPGAGNEYGVMWMPQVGDEVLVAFEHGDIDYPVVLGGLWNGKDVVPFDYGSAIDSGTVTYCGFTSRTGHKVSFFESSSESKIHLLTAAGKVSIELDDKNEVIKVETTGKLVVKAETDIEIKAGGAMKLEATGQLTIKGATVAIN
jgi:phage protein D/phage baseplate assembly protein gpV